MAAISVAGDTSGSITLQAPAVAGSSVLTLPTTTATLITDSSGILNIGSGQIYKDASGNVGIGTSSPASLYKLEVTQSSASSMAARFRINDAHTTVGYNYGVMLQNTDATVNNYTALSNMDSTGASNAWIEFTNIAHSAATPQGAIGFNTRNGANYLRKMTIDTDGNVGIGTSSPSTISKFAVLGSNTTVGTTETVATFLNGAGGSSPAVIRFGNVANNSSGIGNTIETIGYAGVALYTNTATVLTERMRIDSSGNVGIGTSTIASRLSIQGTTATDAPTLGTEFITGGTWTSTGWTGNNTTGWVNGASNVSPLSYSVAAVSATKYQIAYTVTAYSAGSFTIAFGGQSQAGTTATGTWGPTATSTGNLVITPTSTFVGTIIISIKAITAASTALITALDSSGTSRFEVRASSALYNTFLGVNSGRYNTTGSYNTGVGTSTLNYNTTGGSNLAVGFQALTYNTAGINNSAVGVNALLNNTTGSYNSAVGSAALLNNTTGQQNLAVGYTALQNNTTGIANSAVGITALQFNTTGSNNVSLGFTAGRYIADGSTALTVVNNSTYLGTATKASADNVTNETVIGYNAIGSGSNTITLGNSAVTGTIIPYGNVGFSTTPASWDSGGNITLKSGGTLFSVSGALNIGTNAYYNAGWKYGSTGYATNYNQNNGSHTWQYSTSGTAGSAITFLDAMSIDSSGNVAIGIALTSEKLMVQDGNIFSNGGYFRTNRSSASADTTTGLVLQIDGNTQAQITTPASGSMAMYTAATERMHIDSSGNVGIGITTSIPSQLTVSGTGQLVSAITDAGVGTGTLQIHSTSGAVGAGGALLFSAISVGVTTPQWAIKSLLGNGGTNGVGDLVFSGRATIVDTALTERMRISSAGILTLSVALPSTSGGTGTATTAVGDLLQGAATNTWSKLAAVATGNALISGGVTTASSWGKIGLTTHISGTLPVANGGTNASAAGIAAFNNITGYTATGATGTTSTNIVFSTSPVLTTPSLGAATGTSLAVTGAITSSGAGIGYATGAGSAVTQLTSRTTAAPTTGAKLSGAITLFTTTAVVGTYFSFTVPNTAVAITDTIILSVRGASNSYVAYVTAIVAATSFTVTMASVVGTASDAPVVNFAIIKAVSA